MLHSFNALFIKTNLSEINWSFKIDTFIIFNLDFPINTILSCLFFFFLIIDLYFLIPAVIAQIYNPIAELVIPIGILTKEEKLKI